MPKYHYELTRIESLSMQSLPRQEIAYLAALFTYIAKGRAAINPELGAVDAESFGLEQGLCRYEARLVAWPCQEPF